MAVFGPAFLNLARPSPGTSNAAAVLRAAALFFGVFSLLNVAGDLARPGFDASLWWIDLRWLPAGIARSTLVAAAVCLASWGLRPNLGPVRKWCSLTVVSGLTLIAAMNTIVFYVLWAAGRIHPGIPLPVSCFVAALLGSVLGQMLRTATPRGADWTRLGIGFVVSLGVWPLTQVLWFGKTDYRRPADAIVVFGARAYADGKPSDALADRVRTACELYQARLAPRLIFSGGPGDGAVHETEAMRQLALQLGVPDDAIVLDREGLNTRATVNGLAEAKQRLGIQRVLAVSHFYHLARIRLACQRAGVEVRTVPARESYFLRQIPYSVAREVFALWAYYLRAG